MQALRIGDAFEQIQIEAVRIESIVEQLKSYEISTIKTGPGYNKDTGIYYARFYDQGHIYNPKLPQYREPIEINEIELYAVQAVFRASQTPESRQITAKLDEAERRIAGAKDWAAEKKEEQEKAHLESLQPYCWPGLQKL